MTQSYFPFDSGSGSGVTEVQWQKMAQHWLGTGIIPGQLNQLEVFADSTGMQVKVKSGAAWIKGHYYESDAEEVLAISSADPSNPRIDRVIVRLDWTLNTVQLAVLQGIPAAAPVPPALTQNTSRWEIVLAEVRVNAGVSTIAAGNVTNKRTFADDVYLVANKTVNQAIAQGVVTKVTWDSAPDDNHGIHKGSGDFIVPIDGIYDINANIGFNINVTDVQIQLYLNDAFEERIFATPSTVRWMYGSYKIRLKAGDKLSFYAYQNSTTGGSLTTGKITIAKL